MNLVAAQTVGDLRLLSQEAVVGPDLLPFGVTKNRRTLEAWVQGAYEQGVTSRVLDVDMLFAPGTHDVD